MVSTKEESKEYYLKNKERVLERCRNYYKNSDKAKETKKQYYENNKEKVAARQKAYYENNREARLEKAKTYQKANPERSTLKVIKHRALKGGLPFNLDLSDMVAPEYCPVLGIKLVRGSTGRNVRNNPSVDRIIPELGYVKGNIQIISHKANTMKQDATPEELEMFARWILKEKE